MASGAGGWWLLFRSQLPFLQTLLASALLMVAVAFIVRRRFPVERAIEIHPDELIIDGRYVFSADDIGDHWPQLQLIDDDEDRISIAGICGTRYIEFAAADALTKGPHAGAARARSGRSDGNSGADANPCAEAPECCRNAVRPRA